MDKVRFRMKANVGLHHLNGKIVRPGDVIRCSKNQIHGALDKFEQLDPDPPLPQPSVGLKAVHKGHGRWDVVNETTKMPINDQPLTREEAEGLVTEAKKNVQQKEED